MKLVINLSLRMTTKMREQPRKPFFLEKNGGRRGIRTPDQRCVKPLRYHCAIRPTGEMCRPNAERRAGILYNLPLRTSDFIQQFIETPIIPPTSHESTASGKALFANQ